MSSITASFPSNAQSPLIAFVVFGVVLTWIGCAPRVLPLEPFQQGNYMRTTPADVEQLEAAVETPEEMEQVERALAAVLVARQRRGADGASEELTADVLLSLDESRPDADLIAATALGLFVADPSPVVRYHALRLLRHYRSERGVEAAIRAARDDKDPLIAGEARLILE